MEDENDVVHDFAQQHWQGNLYSYVQKVNGRMMATI